MTPVVGEPPEDQRIMGRIGRLLAAIRQPGDAAVEYVGKVYADRAAGAPYRIAPDGAREIVGSRTPGGASAREVLDLARRLAETPPHARDPFTHFRVRLDRDDELDFEFAHVPREQDWPRLFMRGAGELSEEEARAHPIPRDDWLARRRLARGEITREAYDAEIRRVERSADQRR